METAWEAVSEVCENMRSIEEKRDLADARRELEKAHNKDLKLASQFNVFQSNLCFAIWKIHVLGPMSRGPVWNTKLRPRSSVKIKQILTFELFKDSC